MTPPEQSQVAASPPPVLSVLFGTFNRLGLLQTCVESVRKSVRALPYEIVICDAGSTDGSRQWLSEQPDVVLIGRWELTGAVVAFNHCYALSRGKYLVTINDDVQLEGDALAQAAAILDADASVGQVAMALRRYNTGKWIVNYIRPPSYYYANFGVNRREIVDTVAKITGGMWSPVYYTYGADVELSCWVHRLGYKVEPRHDLHVIDHEHVDPLRRANHESGKAERDGNLYNQRWHNKASLVPRALFPNVTDREIEALKAHEAGQPLPDLPPPQVRAGRAPAVLTTTGATVLQEHEAQPGHAPWRATGLPGDERVVHLHLDSPTEPQQTMSDALASLGAQGGGYACVRWPALEPEAASLRCVEPCSRRAKPSNPL